jgi:hypothetical protein
MQQQYAEPLSTGSLPPVLGGRLRIDQNVGATDQPKVSGHQPFCCCFLESRQYIVDGIVDDLAYTIGVNRTALNVVCPAECSGTISVLYARNQTVLGGRLRIDQNVGATDQPKVSGHQSWTASLMTWRTPSE